jgi:hypothetical protein
MNSIGPRDLLAERVADGFLLAGVAGILIDITTKGFIIEALFIFVLLLTAVTLKATTAANQRSCRRLSAVSDTLREGYAAPEAPVSFATVPTTPRPQSVSVPPGSRSFDR